jgi:hypothetical protein
MSPQKTYYAFTCCKLHALTNDKTGSNLPRDLCKAGWKFAKTVTLGPNEKSRIGLHVQKSLADIEMQGYHIVENKVAVTGKVVPPDAGPSRPDR